jgi:uncharacterized protein (TIGR00255 family)
MSQALSMTGFGRAQQKTEHYDVTVEIKSVNNRYKEFRFKMSSSLNALEMDLRKKIESQFKRGTFDININFKRIDNKLSLEIDWNKVNTYLTELKNKVGNQVQFTANPTEFMKGDFVIENENNGDELSQLVLKVFDQALLSLRDTRATEGNKLVQTLRQHKDQYIEFLNKVIPLKETYQPLLREKLINRFKKENIEIKIEEGRFLQEIIYYLEKLDVDEELNRIKIHLNKMDNLFVHSKELGRELEFLLQELGRETNTLGSKSGQSEISESVVQMKVQLEKMREQALNLE